MTIRRKLIIGLGVLVVLILATLLVKSVAEPSPQQRFSQGIHSVSGIHHSEAEINDLLLEYCMMEPLQRAVQYGELYDMVGADKADEITDAADDYCEDF